jgi:hypothetical protein
MSFTGSNRTSQEKLLRTVYQRDMRRLFAYHRFLLQTLKPHTRKVKQGEKMSFPLHLSAGSGFMFSDELYLPEASVEEVDRAYFKFRGMTDKLAIQADFLEDTSSSEGAEMSALKLQTNSIARNGGNDLNFFLYGDGTGKLCGVASCAASNTFVADDVRGLRNNVRIDVLKTASGDVGGGVANAKIKLNKSTKLVTLLGGATWSDGTGAELQANKADYTVYKANSRNKAIFGLEAAIAVGNPPTGVPLYGDIDRTDDTYDNYRGVVHANAGTPRQVSFGLLQDLKDDLEAHSDGEIDLYIAPPPIFKWFIESLVANKRYGGEKVTLKGWAEGVMFGNTPIVKDTHCPPTKMFALDLDTISLVQNDAGKFADKDGSVLHLMENQIAYAAAWYRRAQLVCLVPPANGILADIQHDAVA